MFKKIFWYLFLFIALSNLIIWLWFFVFHQESLEIWITVFSRIENIFAFLAIYPSIRYFYLDKVISYSSIWFILFVLSFWMIWDNLNHSGLSYLIWSNTSIGVFNTLYGSIGYGIFTYISYTQIKKYFS